MMRDRTQDVECHFHVGVCQAELARLTLRDGFVRENRQHQDTDREVARVQSLQEHKRGAAPRAF